jgi:hypothetical protein
MQGLPKGIREATRDLDRGRFEIGRCKRHYAIVDRVSGQVMMTLAANYSKPGGRMQKNQLAEMRRRGLLKEGSR